MTGRQQLRLTFDSAAGRYHAARPDYPDALYDELIAMTGLRTGDRLLEIGCGTGKATIPLARAGFRLTCVELGPELASAARANLAGFSGAEVVAAQFETWQPARAGYDLVFAATAWHWLDPAVKYRRARDLLRPGGHLAFWTATHVFPAGGDSFFRDIQPVYDEIGESLPPDALWTEPGQLPDSATEIAASGFFADAQTRQFDWEISYDAEGYIQLLDTFSGHMTMQHWQRDRLYGEIRRGLADRPAGLVRRHWGAVLNVAQRR